ncbi:MULTISPECIES: signal peptidase I [unclassified Paenibacillus]|uniref:signal peptidase I n=1 Tax=unclassified Paenibacillus TaxID=185978 RepID=UPI001AE254BA|nr:MULTISPECIES: signal peptidase I [unclassified Paenibacillus]MBP1156031.1 signal peptidase I [Paenibacillus sp. PvP091]MBP1168583.1 signal peptidase I [Paenibacillus sp. PvR098]MBP2439611.1 signal peptidase I [Paenibacillus sp. PvP052]
MEQDQTVEKANPIKNEAWEWIKALLIAAALVFFIRWLVFAPFIVEGPSMEPNFHTGERLIVNKFIYKFDKPERGEVLVFHATEDKDYIKRVVALPGEKVRVEGDQVFVNGEPLDEPYLKQALDEAAEEGKPYNTRNYPEHTVAEGSVFVMGDNRSNSSDSRDSTVGFVKYEQIVGRADLIFWPFDKISLVHF